MSSKTIPIHARVAVLGIAFGFVFSCTGFTDYLEVHKMFTFQDLRMFLMFCGGVALSMAGFFVFARKRSLPARKFHKGTVPGGMLFGVGWALAGACPSGALVQLGEGKVLAAFTVAGIVIGAAVYPLVHRRVFRWALDSCET